MMPLGAIAVVAAISSFVAGCAGRDEGDQPAFCERRAAIDDLDRALSGNPTALRNASDDLGGLAQVAPVEVRDDVEVLAAAVGTMATAAEQSRKAGGDEDAALEAAVRALEPDLALIEESSATLARYTAATCEDPLPGTGSG
jgi:hypothetical protein